MRSLDWYQRPPFKKNPKKITYTCTVKGVINMSSEWKVGSLSASTGQKVKGYLEFPSIEEKLPTFLINGKSEGPRVLVIGGIHGCEYTSIDAALKVAQELTPNIKGKVAIIPIANPASFYERSIYVHPKDQKNLNRMFPGKKVGSEAERLAYWLNETCLKNVDYVIDLHGGDMIEALVPFTIYHVSNDDEVLAKSKEMSSLFDIQYVIGSKGEVPGSTYGCAAEQGTPAIIAEAGQQGILSEKDSLTLQEGVKNILRSLEVLTGDAIHHDSTFLTTFEWYRAEEKGLWYPAVKTGDHVAKGDILGEIKDEFGENLKTYVSTVDGVVLFLVTSLAIKPNDPLLAVGK